MVTANSTFAVSAALFVADQTQRRCFMLQEMSAMSCAYNLAVVLYDQEHLTKISV